MTDMYSRYTEATRLFEQRAYTQATRILEELLADGPAYGLAEAPLLLARSYYHSAQIDKARVAAERLVEADPSDGYAALLLARSLDRQGRAAEAARAHRLAALMDAPA